MQIPGFLARQFYVAGSLRNTPSGFRLQAHNPLGDGTLVGVGRIAVDGREIPLDSVTATRDDGSDTISAAAVTRASPIAVRRGDRVTLEVRGDPLAAGEHRLEVELHERDLGALRLEVTDQLSG